MTLSRLQQLLLICLALISFIGAIGILMMSGLPRHADYSGFIVDGEYVAPVIGERAPPIDANTLSGQHLHLEDLYGESVVINFWATWCVPCAIEMPELQALYDETGIRVLGVNIAESRAIIQQWVESYQLTFDIVLDPDATIYTDYRLIGQPTTYIINPDGIITHIYYGATTADTLLSAIETH